MKAFQLPKLNKKDNLTCKLDEVDIENIQKLHKLGNSYASIGRKYGVTWVAIRYWCWSEEKRKEKNSHKKERLSKERRKEIRNKHIKRRKEITPKRFYDTQYRLQSEDFRKRNPVYVKDYYHRNIEKRREYARNWYRKNVSKVI